MLGPQCSGQWNKLLSTTSGMDCWRRAHQGSEAPWTEQRPQKTTNEDKSKNKGLKVGLLFCHCCASNSRTLTNTPSLKILVGQSFKHWCFHIMSVHHIVHHFLNWLCLYTEVFQITWLVTLFGLPSWWEELVIEKTPDAGCDWAGREGSIYMMVGRRTRLNVTWVDAPERWWTGVYTEFHISKELNATDDWTELTHIGPSCTYQFFFLYCSFFLKILRSIVDFTIACQEYSTAIQFYRLYNTRVSSALGLYWLLISIYSSVYVNSKTLTYPSLWPFLFG